MSSKLETPEAQAISSTLLRTKTRDILEQAKFRGQRFIVETFGKPMLANVGVDEYWDLHDLAHTVDSSPTPEEPVVFSRRKSCSPDASCRTMLVAQADLSSR